MTGNFLSKHKLVIIYSSALGMLLCFLKWLEWRFLVIDHTLEIYIGVIAILFTGLGIWLALKLIKPKIESVVVEKEIYISSPSAFKPSEAAINQLGLTHRELEVLQLIAAGYSNQEIADQLFLSLNTIKTHAARLFEKMEVSRRTQAIDTGKKWGILP